MPAADVEPSIIENEQYSIIELLENHPLYKSVERWYNAEGLIHRDNDLPAEIYISKNTDEIIKEKWYRNGVLHRDGNLPSVIRRKYNDGNIYIAYEIWYKNGLKHRDNNEPAKILNVPYHCATQWYYINGIKKNVDESKPAKIIIYKNGEIESTWYIDGKKGRADDLPARECRYITGKLSYEYWYVNNLKHRDNDKPAKIWYHNDTVGYEWYQFGKRYKENNQYNYERKTLEGKLIVREIYNEFDELHSLNNLPASIKYYPDTGIIKIESWYYEYKLHREGNKPAKRCYYDNGTLMKESYYINGKSRRSGNLPIKIWYNKNGTPSKFKYQN